MTNSPMSKTYAARLARLIREVLPADTEFVIEADLAGWKGYVFATHPNSADAGVLPVAEDKRAPVAEDVVQETLRTIADQLFPHDYYPAKWQAQKREAHSAWVAQTGIEL